MAVARRWFDATGNFPEPDHGGKLACEQLLGDRLLIVPYEALVSEPAKWIRRILAHCGLTEEPQVFASHENKQTVSTASVMQVRRPINRDAVGSAEPYREFLDPFVRAYHE